MVPQFGLDDAYFDEVLISTACGYVASGVSFVGDVAGFIEGLIYPWMP